MKQLGRAITEEEAVLMMSEADADGDGSIDFMEFRKIVARKSKSKLWCALIPSPCHCWRWRWRRCRSADL